MQEPTTTTAAATSSCPCPQGSPDSAMAQPRCTATRGCPLTPPFALCPLTRPVTKRAARPLPSDAGLADAEEGRPLSARRTAGVLVPHFPPGIRLPRAISRPRAPETGAHRAPRGPRCQGRRKDPAGTAGTPLRAAGEASQERARRPEGAHAALGGGASGSAHVSGRGARADRCVGRGRARVTCAPRSRRLPIGLSSRYLDWGWCGEVGSRVAPVALRIVVSMRRGPASPA